MIRKKVLFVVTNTKKKLFILIGTILIILTTVCTLMYAHHITNPLTNVHIIIDPGHGGVDGGTSDNGVLEKDINLQISAKLQTIFESNNAHADLTRYTDISLDNQNDLSDSRHKRDLLSRISLFNSKKYDIFISIHVNRSDNRAAMGPIVLYSTKNPQSPILANCIQGSLNKQDNLNKIVEHLPVYSSKLFILNNSEIPGVIIETGFISNPDEKALLRDEAYQIKLSKSIYNGVKDYFMLKGNYTGDQLPEHIDTMPFSTIDDARMVLR